MIEQLLHQVLYLTLQALFFALPTMTMPPGLSLSLLSAADVVLPLSELALALGVLVAFATASLGYTLLMRVAKFIRGAG